MCREIAECLGRDGVSVFPLLVDGAQMPSPPDLPETIRGLSRRQAYPIVARHWANDLAVLVDILRRLPDLNATTGGAKGLPPPGTGEGGAESQRRMRWALVGGIALVLMIGLAIVALDSEHGQPRLSEPVAAKAELPNQGPVALPDEASALANPAAVSEARLPVVGTAAPPDVEPSTGVTEPLAAAASPAGRENRDSMQSHQTSVHRSGDTFRDCSDCPELVVVPAGEFMMGSPEGEQGRAEGEGPRHRARIGEPFAVGKVEVTFDQWAACVVAGGCSHQPEAVWGRNGPVVDVSWNDAQAYLTWLSKKTGQRYRLLSEAEWEYAARATSTTSYPWGNEPGRNKANFYDSGSRWNGKQAAQVGQFDANHFGLYDMIGNVFEWVEDCWHESYQDAPANGTAWTSGRCDYRIVRGGSWLDTPNSARSAYRVRNQPGIRTDDLGFRLARTLRAPS